MLSKFAKIFTIKGLKGQCSLRDDGAKELQESRWLRGGGRLNACLFVLGLWISLSMYL